MPGCVKKQTPFLDGLPTLLFGSSKTPAQERLRLGREGLIGRSPGELSAALADVIPPGAVSGFVSDPRRRTFTGEVTFWAFLGQVLGEDGSCSRAVAGVQSWFRDHGLEPPSADTSSYCKARQRLPCAMLDSLHGMLVGDLGRWTPSDLLWHGHIVKAADATSVQLPDTGANQRAYPQPSGQKAGCGHPVMKLSGLINLCHGGWERFVVGDRHHHDHAALGEILGGVGRGEILVADRAYCSYEAIARSTMQGSDMVVRLHQKRKVDWRRGKKMGPNQRVVTWVRPRRPRGANPDAEAWRALPDSMEVRLIKVKTTGRDGKAKTLILATTLLDAARYPAGDIADLYCRRWEIELRFRDLKTTMGMELLRTRTPEMARKEVAMHIIAYNAVRSLMLLAADGSQEELWRISFKGTLQVLDAWAGQFRKTHRRPLVRAGIFAEMLVQISFRAVHERPGRSEPRAVKRRPKPFPLLTAPRREYKEIFHRSRYRKPAGKVA